ncbi:MAG: hypothetical protein VB144_15380, partial [Clostridia bacterium]|nr:hypothetical protein [Clostridia bacterium]
RRLSFMSSYARCASKGILALAIHWRSTDSAHPRLDGAPHGSGRSFPFLSASRPKMLTDENRTRDFTQK